jgi:hypothetical protein
MAKDSEDSYICIAIGYSDPDAIKEEGMAKAAGGVASYGIPVSELVGYRQYDSISVPPAEEVALDWFNTGDEL